MPEGRSVGGGGGGGGEGGDKKGTVLTNCAFLNFMKQANRNNNRTYKTKVSLCSMNSAIDDKFVPSGVEGRVDRVQVQDWSWPPAGCWTLDKWMWPARTSSLSYFLFAGATPAASAGPGGTFP